MQIIFCVLFIAFFISYTTAFIITKEEKMAVYVHVMHHETRLRIQIKQTNDFYLFSWYTVLWKYQICSKKIYNYNKEMQLLFRKSWHHLIKSALSGLIVLTTLFITCKNLLVTIRKWSSEIEIINLLVWQILEPTDEDCRNKN